MVEGKTKSGFKYKIDERIQSDWRLVKAIADSQNENPGTKLQGTVDMIKLVLGNQEELLMQHIMKENDGFIPMEVMNTEITEIIQSIPKAKTDIPRKMYST